MRMIPGSLGANVIEAPTLGDGWLAALGLVLDTGLWTDDGAERLLEVLPLAMRIATVDEDDPFVRAHADEDRIALMLEKHRSLAVLPQYKVSYGRLLYDNHDVDQVAWAAQRIVEKRETKSATIGLTIPGGAEQSCLSLLDFKLRSEAGREALAMTAVYRSQNVWGSQPGNVLALREVQEQVAGKVGVPMGRLDLFALSAHIYERDLGRARAARDAGEAARAAR